MTDQANAPIRIVLLDTHTLIRSGLRTLLSNQAGMDLVGEAGSLGEAIRIVAHQNPDIILFEVTPGSDLGLGAIPQLIQANPHARLILVTSSTDFSIYIQAVQNGVLGVVLTTQPPEILFKAIRIVATGEAWIERSMVAPILMNITRNQQGPCSDSETGCVSQLSPREQDIVELIGKGLNNRKIATQLCISETTVRHNLTSIYEKLGVTGRLELLVFAYRSGMTHLSNISD
jgi:DNA-binding NarL/FixJ family response regulator